MTQEQQDLVAYFRANIEGDLVRLSGLADRDPQAQLLQQTGDLTLTTEEMNMMMSHDMQHLLKIWGYWQKEQMKISQQII